MNRADNLANVLLRLRWMLVSACVLNILSSAPLLVIGQEAGMRPRAKIGLALSGGGARGFAHIGVLQWFEEHRIPVDYIAGTSMGGLVGGMYAAGMSPEEMRKLVGSLDWDDILRGYPSFQQLSYRRKEDRLYIPGPITLGLRRGVNLPAGINAGMDIGLVFDHLTLPYDNVGSFDNLPIPFRCVATDLVAAEQVILKDGSLSRSLRATMSIPGLFTPVELDGKILADGGILNNLPTDVVKQMGADVVIAVDIGTPLGDKESLNSIFGVLSQTSGVATAVNTRRNLRLADLIISPELAKHTMLDFKANAEITDLGYKGAEQQALLLQKFSLSEGEWQQYLALRRSRILKDVPAPTFIKVEGTSPDAAQAIAREFGEFEGKPIDPQEVAKDLINVWGMGRFESLEYSWIRENEKNGLLIRAQEKTYGPPFLDLGLLVNNSATDDTEINLLGRLTFFDIGGANAEWRNDFSLGTRILIGTEYFRPLGERGFFVAPNASYDTLQRNLYSDGEKIAVYKQKTAMIGADFGYILSARSQMQLGYSIGHLEGQRTIGDPILPDVSGTQSVVTFNWNYFGQNSAQFPTRGLLFQSSANWFFKSPGATTGFPQAEAVAIYAHHLTERNILLLHGAGGTTFGREASPFQKFALGGLFHLGGYGRGEFRGNNYLFGELGYLRQLYQLPLFLGGNIYGGVWYDGGSAFDDFDLARYQNSGTGGILLETRLGPIFFGGSWAEGGRGKLYFVLGRIF